MRIQALRISALKALATVVLVTLVASACGQKPGVHAGGGTQVATGGEGGDFVFNPETGELIRAGEAGGASGGGSSSTTTGGGGGSGGGSSGGSAQALPGDTDGITSKQILLGFHAPLTGAAAVPLADIAAGTELYSKWLTDKGVTIHGRTIKTIWRNDKYNPADAVRECRDMVEREKVFALIGAAGTDQIVACANYAARKGVPYLSAGVSEDGLNKLNNYFAFTMSYPAQAKPLAEMIQRFTAPAEQGGGKVLVDRCPDSNQSTDLFCAGNGPASSAKVAMVFSDTDGFYDARDSFLQDLKKISLKDATAFAITKFNMSSSQANTLVQSLKGGGYDVVYILTSPTNWLAILRVAEGQRYAPRWVGVGLTKGVNLVPTTACQQSRNSFTNSLFLNPWFAVDNPNASQFAQAWGQYGDGSPYREHDIAFGLWGGSVTHHAMFEAVGPDLSRSKFINKVQTLKKLKAVDTTKAGNIIDIYSELNFSPSDHFGANQAHLLYGDCSQVRWLDVPGKQFVSGF
jgi:ABC-type branched-subunit amino acid transport system substrate-binding protein